VGGEALIYVVLKVKEVGCVVLKLEDFFLNLMINSVETN
jgi:hypothetical protein